MIYFESSELQMHTHTKKARNPFNNLFEWKTESELNGDAPSGLPDLFPISPRRSLGIIIFSCESVFCKDDAKHLCLPC